MREYVLPGAEHAAARTREVRRGRAPASPPERGGERTAVRAVSPQSEAPRRGAGGQGDWRVRRGGAGDAAGAQRRPAPGRRGRAAGAAPLPAHRDDVCARAAGARLVRRRAAAGRAPARAARASYLHDPACPSRHMVSMCNRMSLCTLQHSLLASLPTAWPDALPGSRPLHLLLTALDLWDIVYLRANLKTMSAPQRSTS